MRDPLFEGSENQYHSKPSLTPRQRDEIGKRRYNGEGPLALAIEFGVSRAVIQNISKIEN